MRTVTSDAPTEVEPEEILDEVLDDVSDDTTGNYTLISEDLNENYDTLAEAFEVINSQRESEFTVVVHADATLDETVLLNSYDTHVTLTSDDEAKTLTQVTPGKRHFSVTGNSGLILENITLDGNDTGGGVEVFGYLSGVSNSLTVGQGGTIRNCQAEDGGGVSVKNLGNFVALLEGGVISNNKALGSGGGIHVSGGAVLWYIEGEMTGNSANADGGAIFVFTIHNDYVGAELYGKPTFSGNTAGNGIKYDSSFEGVDRMTAAGTSVPEFSTTNPVNNYDFNSSTQEVMNFTLKDEISNKTTYFATLTDAFDAINNDVADTNSGAKYTVTANTNDTMTAGTPISFSRDVEVTLTSSGTAKTITQTEGRHFKMEQGKLTLENIKLDGTSTGGGVEVKNAVTALTLEAGTVIQNCKGFNGGGIAATDKAAVEINASSIIDNYTTSNGGGIYASEDATVSVTDSNISGNFAADTGGGIDAYAGAELTIRNTDINQNTAENRGGGIHTDKAIITLDESLISGNTASSGGGIFGNWGSAIKVSNSDISGNTAESQGGGVFGFNETSITLQDSNISGNRAVNGSGGGIYLDDRWVTLTVDDVADGTTFSDNYAETNGGAIFTWDENYRNVTLADTATFTDNRVGNDMRFNGNVTKFSVAGTSLSAVSKTNPVNNLDISSMKNTEMIYQVAGNGAASKVDGWYTSLYDAFGAISRDESVAYTVTATEDGDLKGKTASLTRGDAKVTLTSQDPTSPVTLTEQTAGTRHIKLTGGAQLTLKNITLSGANASGNASGGGIEATGSGTELALEEGTSIQKCKANYGGGVYAASSTVNLSGDAVISNNTAGYGGGGVYAYSNTTVSLSGEAAISNNTASYDGGGVYAALNTTVNLSGDAVISDNTAIWNGGGVYAASNTTVNLSGNAAISNNTASYDGGGVYAVSNTTISLSNNAAISNNEAVSRNGGGVYAVSNTTVGLSGDAVISDNTARWGGGVYITSTSTVTLEDNTVINGNTASYGGGVYATDTSTVKLTRKSSVSRNTAEWYGGGLYALLNSTIILTDEAAVNKNMATTYGGGVYLSNESSLTTSDATAFIGNQTVTYEGAGGAIYSGDKLLNNLTLSEGTRFDRNMVIGNLEENRFFDKFFKVNGTSKSADSTNPVNNFDINSPYIDPAWNYAVRGALSGGFANLHEALAAINGDTIGNTDYTVYVLKDNAQVNNEINDAVPQLTREVNVLLTSMGDTKTLTQTAGRHVELSGKAQLTLENIILDGDRMGGGVDTLNQNLGDAANLILLAGAKIQDCHKDGEGGGVRANGSMVILAGGSISGNATTSYGGGIYASDSMVVLAEGSVSENKAVDWGGGIYAADSTTVYLAGGSISGNTASLGGGIFVHMDSTVELSGGAITKNAAETYSGGGIYLSMDAELTISASAGEIKFADNTATQDGGAIHTEDFASDNLMLNDKVAFTGNTAASIIYNKDSGLTAARTSLPEISATNPANNYDVSAMGQAYYTITYNRNDSTELPATEVRYVPGGADTRNILETLETLRWTTPEGQAFTGWTTKPDGTGTLYSYRDAPTAIEDLEDNATLYARWGHAFTITAGAGGSITGSYDEHYAEGEEIAVTAEPNSTDYTFDQWTATAEGSFDNEENASATFTMPGSAAEVTASFRYTPAEATLSAPSGADGWFVAGDSITLTAPEGSLISADGAGDWKDSLTLDDTDGAGKTTAYYLKDDDTGLVSAEMTCTYKVDKTAPTGSIWLKRREVTQLPTFAAGPVYDIFAKGRAEFEITRTDDTSGVALTEWQWVPRGSELGDNWHVYHGLFHLNPQAAVYYARITDNAGNQHIINTSGMVVYIDSEVEAAHQYIAHTRPNQTEAFTTVNLNYNALGTVTNTTTGEALTAEDYYFVPSGNDQGQLNFTARYLNDLPAGTYELELTFKPFGLDYIHQTGNDVPATAVIYLTVARSANAISEVEDLELTYAPDKKIQLAPELTGDAPLSYHSRESTVASVDADGEITVKGAGEAEITITASETDDYEAVDKTILVKVAKAENVITGIDTELEKTFGDDNFTLEPQALGGAVLSFESDNTAVAAVDAFGEVTIKGGGQAVLTVVAAATANYHAKSAEVVLSVKQAANRIEVVDNWNVRLGDDGFTLIPRALGDTGFTFTSDDEGVAAVAADGSVTHDGRPGVATVTVASEATVDYLAAIREVRVNVVDPATVSALEELLAAAAALEEGDYTAVSWQGLPAAVAAAEAVLADEDATEAELQQALSDLQAAIDELRRGYVFTEEFETFTGAGELTGKVNGELADFVQLLQDGEAVDSAHYILAAGSTVITLKESYLKTLANGAYTLTAEYIDGTADTTLTVDVKTAADLPGTGAGNSSGSGGGSSSSTSGKRLPQTGETAIDLTLMGTLLLGVWLVLKRWRKEDQLELE